MLDDSDRQFLQQLLEDQQRADYAREERLRKLILNDLPGRMLAIGVLLVVILLLLAYVARSAR